MSEPGKVARATRNRLFSNLCYHCEKFGYAKSGAVCMICTAQEIQNAIDSTGSGMQEQLEELVRFVERVSELTCTFGMANEPCTLNASDDPNEFCLPHLAREILEKRTGETEETTT